MHEAASVTGSMSGYLHGVQNDELVLRASMYVNTLLLVGKAAAAFMSSSPAIMASLVDSGVDVVVQAALFWASRASKRGATSAMYPAGRGQMEPVAVVLCAALKCAGMAYVAIETMNQLYEADQDVTKHGCIHSHDVHRHGWHHILHSHWESVALLA